MMPRSGDETLVLVLRDSALIRRAERVMRWLQDVVSGSAVAASLGAILGRWKLAPAADRRRSIAIMLLVAAAVYVSAVLLTGEPRGWLWTIIPAVAILVGGLFWSFSTASRSSE